MGGRASVVNQLRELLKFHRPAELLGDRRNSVVGLPKLASHLFGKDGHLVVSDPVGSVHDLNSKSPEYVRRLVTYNRAASATDSGTASSASSPAESASRPGRMTVHPHRPALKWNMALRADVVCVLLWVAPRRPAASHRSKAKRTEA